MLEFKSVKVGFSHARTHEKEREIKALLKLFIHLLIWLSFINDNDYDEPEAEDQVRARGPKSLWTIKSSQSNQIKDVRYLSRSLSIKKKLTLLTH